MSMHVVCRICRMVGSIRHLHATILGFEVMERPLAEAVLSAHFHRWYMPNKLLSVKVGKRSRN